MPQAIGHILPIAVAVALSSVPITATILILLSHNRNRSAVPFLVGWVIGLVLVVTICTVFAQALPAARSPRRPDTVIGAVEILIGAGLLIVAFTSWRRGRQEAVSSLPKWLTSVGTLGGWGAFGLALLLNIRPKALLLAMAAGLALRAEKLSLTQSAIVILVYAAIAASTVVGPIIATLVAPDKAAPRLGEARDWLTRNGSLVGSLILAVIAAVVIGSGLGRL
jgi:hypothetical protein